MAKRKPDRRPTSQNAPQQPRDRLAEIRAEIRDVQQQIEAKRRDTRLIRSAEDLKAWERSIGELTNHLAALLLAEAMQAALSDPENRCQARSLALGARPHAQGSRPTRRHAWDGSRTGRRPRALLQPQL